MKGPLFPSKEVAPGAKDERGGRGCTEGKLVVLATALDEGIGGVRPTRSFGACDVGGGGVRVTRSLVDAPATPPAPKAFSQGFGER